MHVCSHFIWQKKKKEIFLSKLRHSASDVCGFFRSLMKKFLRSFVVYLLMNDFGQLRKYSGFLFTCPHSIAVLKFTIRNLAIFFSSLKYFKLRNLLNNLFLNDFPTAFLLKFPMKRCMKVADP